MTATAAAGTDSAGPILDVQGLTVTFRTDEGPVTAVESVDFRLDRGRTLGLVGESGSGKSVSTKALIKLLPKNAKIAEGARIGLRRKDGDWIDVATLPADSAAVRRLRGGEIAMIFQEPMASFSPVYTVGNQIMEAIRRHRGVGKREARTLAVEMLDQVGIANAALRVDQYPHELSGGMRQRAMIAVALSTRPAVLIADEPTTALDVTIQAQILKLMRALQDQVRMSMIFITHDMGVIARVADDIAVMYLGRIVERGPTRTVIADPKHPYTVGLLKAIPSMGKLERRLTPVPGDIPSPLERPTGCPFHTRCDRRMRGICDRHDPKADEVGAGHSVACHLFG